jgi:hypothetical protein
VGKLHLDRRPVTLLVAALAVAGCHSPPGGSAAPRRAAASVPGPVRTPGPAAASGYLHAGRSSVAYLQWSAAGRADLTGTLRLTVLSGTAPRQVLAARSYPFTGRIRRGRALTIRLRGTTARGILSGSTTSGGATSGRATSGSTTLGGATSSNRLTLGPLPDSGLTRTFRASTADGYSRAVAALRDRARRSDALASQVAARATLRRQQAAQAVATLITAALAVHQARRVVSGQLRGMRDETALSAVALGKARRDAGQGLARARVGARRVLVCGYAVAVDSDAQAVSAYSTGIASDAGSLSGDVTALQAAIADLSARLRVVLRRQPGYSGGGLAPSPDLVRNKISRATQRIGAALAEANGYVDQLNLYVATAYRLSARTAAARTCRSASPTPAPLARISQTP